MILSRQNECHGISIKNGKGGSTMCQRKLRVLVNTGSPISLIAGLSIASNEYMAREKARLHSCGPFQDRGEFGPFIWQEAECT